MKVYRVVVEDDELNEDQKTVFVKFLVNLKAVIKTFMHSETIKGLKVYSEILPSRLDRMNLLNRTGFVSTKLFFEVTREEWDKPDYVFNIMSDSYSQTLEREGR